MKAAVVHGMKAKTIFRTLICLTAVGFLATLWPPGACGQKRLQTRIDQLNQFPCCEFSEVPGVIWWGNNPKMSLHDLARYCAPILWFSPDEPLLKNAKGVDIRIPEPFPFEEPSDGPVVYYRCRTILGLPDAQSPAYTPLSDNRSKSIIDLQETVGIDLDYFFYYSEESGLGRHDHDVESAEFKIAVWRREQCPDCRYALLVTRVVGKAHGILWYDNTLEVDDPAAKFPMTILVEEGKHASCTDKNGDGYFTPAYDVNRHPNDAWGVRDVMGAGLLFSGGFQSWFAKVRSEEHRVFPPLPEDSPLRKPFTKDGRYAPENAHYSLRPFPSAEKAQPDLVHFIADKGDPNWPLVEEANDFKKFARWVEADSFSRSLAIAYRYDGKSGFSFSFPLLIVKNVEEPLAGGFILHRIYFQDHNLRDFGWMLHYTRSASRWADGYFSAGVEWDKFDSPEGSEEPTKTQVHFVFETGVKFRFGLERGPLKFLTKLTDFWGIRLGIKNIGAFNINRLAYVVEIGAGTW